MEPSTIQELNESELRSFGLSTGAIIAILFGALIPWLWDLRYPVWPWVILAVLGLWALIMPKSLRSVYRVWMRIGLLLSKVTTPIILGIVFFVVIVPAGLAFITFSRNSLKLLFDANVSTYRIESVGKSTDALEKPY